MLSGEGNFSLKRVTDGPMPTKLDAEYWRTLARETFATAQAMADPESKKVLLRIAEAYERLAERAQAPKKLPMAR